MNNNWKDKILEGYFYNIENSENYYLVTGSGGAIMFGTILEEKGATDELIQDSIKVFVQGKYIPLSQLKILKKD